MQILKNVARHWIPLTVIITLLSGLLYVAVQQAQRMGANDPQIQMAEDAAAALTGGQSAESVLPTAKTDIAASLALYLIVYDDSGQPVAGSGLLHNQLPALPAGVFDYVRRNGESRITWQPEPSVRSAIIVTRIGGSDPGFVMAGRSLREVENRISNLEWMVGLGWLGTCFAAFLAVIASELLFGRDRA